MCETEDKSFNTIQEDDDREDRSCSSKSNRNQDRDENNSGSRNSSKRRGSDKEMESSDKNSSSNQSNNSSKNNDRSFESLSESSMNDSSKDLDDEINYSLQKLKSKIYVKATINAFMFNEGYADENFEHFIKRTSKENIIIKSWKNNNIWINCMKTNKSYLKRLLKGSESAVFDNVEIQLKSRGDAEFNKILKCFSKLEDDLELKRINLKALYKSGKDWHCMNPVNLIPMLDKIKSIVFQVLKISIFEKYFNSFICN